MKKSLVVLVAGLLASIISLSAQNADTTKLTAPVVSISGYADLYYGFEANQPESRSRPGFIYSHNRVNEFNLNNAYIKGNITADNYRGTIALHTGTYVRANYAAEPDLLRLIYEANAGVKLREGLWLDAGIFASHIGFESAVGADCWTLTRSILADNSPYFESGVKLTYEPNAQWLFSAMVLNGWQTIQETNNNKALGTQITYKPSSKLTLNSSTFYGNEKPDSAAQYRFFHNFYGIWQATERLGFTLGWDYGTQQRAAGQPGGWDTWHAGAVIVRYKLAEKWYIAARGEYYNDKKGAFISSPYGGVNLSGTSLNLDYAPATNVLWRIEGKVYSSPDKLFEKKKDFFSETSNVLITSSLAFKF